MLSIVAFSILEVLGESSLVTFTSFSFIKTQKIQITNIQIYLLLWHKASFHAVEQPSLSLPRHKSYAGQVLLASRMPHPLSFLFSLFNWLLLSLNVQRTQSSLTLSVFVLNSPASPLQGRLLLGTPHLSSITYPKCLISFFSPSEFQIISFLIQHLD